MFSNINHHKEITSLFQNNQFNRLYDFDRSRLNVLLEMLMIRDGVMGLPSFSDNEVDVMINDICTSDH